MHCDTNYYLCKNLVFLDEKTCVGFVCSLLGKKCRCKHGEDHCFMFEQEEEE